MVPQCLDPRRTYERTRFDYCTALSQRRYTHMKLLQLGVHSLWWHGARSKRIRLMVLLPIFLLAHVVVKRSARDEREVFG